MAVGIRPTVDFAFKLVLGSPEHTAVTMHFLNAVLEGTPRIEQVTILNPILPKETDEDKLAVLDVLAEDETGRQMNIEMQTSLPTGLAKRLAYYASSLYVEQLTEGVGYELLRPAISICVLEQAMFPGMPQLHLDFQLREQGSLLLTDTLQIHLVELSKSRATEHNLQEVVPLERWAYFLRHAEEMDGGSVRWLLPEPEFAEAMGVLEMIAKTPEEKMLYQARLKRQRDEAARLEFARAEGRDEGRDEGRQEGREVGRQEGLEEGRKEGRQEGERIGRIRLLQQLMGLPETPSEELSRLTAEEMDRQIAELQRRFAGRTL